MSKHVGVGVGVLVTKQGKVLYGLRKNAHGAGTWAEPGGHIEYGESLEQAAIRETKEETGMNITNVRQVAVTNDIFEEEQKQYVTIWMQAETTDEPELLEPDKCEGWEWVNWDALPQPLALFTKNLLKQGFRPQGL